MNTIGQWHLLTSMELLIIASTADTSSIRFWRAKLLRYEILQKILSSFLLFIRKKTPPNTAAALQKLLLIHFGEEDREITPGSSPSVASYSLPRPVISTLGKMTEIGSTYEISISTKLSAIKPMEEKFDVKLDTYALRMGKIRG